MAGQLWVTSSLGGDMYSPKLSKKFRMQAQPLMRFRQFVDTKESLGKNAGDTVNWEKVANISTQGGTLTETTTIPERQWTNTKGTLSLLEYGNAIPLTRKVTELSELDIEDITKRTLRYDMAKVIDSAVYTQFGSAKIKYCGTSTATYVISTNGSMTISATSSLIGYHIKNIVDYLRSTMLAPPYDDDGNYVCIASTQALRQVFDALESTAAYTTWPLNGEVGRYYDVRFVRATGTIDNSIGLAATPTGEAFFFGSETVMEAIAVPEELIAKVPTDYGRSKGLAWYAILGHKIMWSGDPDNTIVHWTSA